MFFPGIGQIYAGRLFKGIAWIIVQASLIIVTAWSLFSPDGQTGTGLWGLLGIIIAYGVNIFDAHRTVYKLRQDKTLEKIPRKVKNPWFAVSVSRVLPGLGQLYNSQVILGVSFLAVFLICLRLKDFFPGLFIIPPLITALATYHVYHNFPNLNSQYRHHYRSLVAGIIGLIFACGIISNSFPDWLQTQVTMFGIPSKSMVPTLQIGDRVLVRLSSNYVPDTGDIIVFNTPDEVRQIDPKAGDYFIKRVIGKPGDIIAVEQGQVYLNGFPLPESYIAEPSDYSIESFKVPQKQYFVLGDNRNNSLDSHAWGFLSQSAIIGQAYKVAWPLDRVKSLMLR
jgi:signal peptidase I